MTLKNKLSSEIFSIPNILCYFRLLMIPVFCIVYLRAEVVSDYYIAAAILVAATLTDFLDGFIARKFDMITDLGKIIDPIIDKLMQLAVTLCLCRRYSLMWIVVALLVVKESYMSIMGIRHLRSGEQIRGALWFGKVCTAVLFITLIALVLFPAIPPAAVSVVIAVNIVFMLFSLLMYINYFRKLR